MFRAHYDQVHVLFFGVKQNFFRGFALANYLHDVALICHLC